MISTVELKKYIASASIFCIIIGEFCHKKKLYLVILFEINKGSKVSFHCNILPFGLTIRLWVKGDRKSPLNTKEIV